ncbi:MAG: hypothetical protein KDI92_00530 [Xanthomonadales bacterium]|nr:hypothetical protein [Xanthomonadales bacterium]
MNKGILLIGLSGFLMSCGTEKNKTVPNDPQPEYQKKVYYDAVNDDLLTAGLGLSGLQGSPPVLSENPTAKELRQASYYHQFKALNDLTESGGYGHLHGITHGQQPIAGYEYWEQKAIKSGAMHTVVVQIPDGMQLQQPCLVVAPSSGSRNVLGAVGTSGVWALQNGCAVVYTDKGTGTEIALSDYHGYQIDGVLTEKTAANELLSSNGLSSPSPLHVVQKHPYSQDNPERYWGEFVLDAANYGLAILEAEKKIERKDVLVIAASLSNGGGAVLRAAELDTHGVIDGVVAAEPQLNLQHAYQLKQDGKVFDVQTKALLELSTWLSLYEPCAALDASLSTAPFKLNTGLIQPLLVQRCQALVEVGLLNGNTVEEQAADALSKIQQQMIEPAALELAQINTLAGMWAAINHTYSNSYLQKTAKDNLCHSAMSAFSPTGQPRELTTREQQGMFALSNGIAPGNGVELAYSNKDNVVQSRMILAPAYGLESQLCFFELSQSDDMLLAIKNIIAKPKLNSLPTLILHGQADGTVAINHSSRAYYHRNQSSESPNELMRYYEVEHVQHFDAFLAYPGFQEKFVPMHPYFEQAMDMMLAHLRTGSALAPSQVVKTSPRGNDGEVVNLSEVHIPAISKTPDHPINVVKNKLVLQ